MNYNNEIDFLNRSTGKDFEFVKELGRGAHSTAVLVKNQEGQCFVCKFPNTHWGTEKQKNGSPVAFVNSAFVSVRKNIVLQKLKKVNACDVKIPKQKRYGDICLEEFGGYPLTEVEWKDKDICAKIATFYSTLHKGEWKKPQQEPIYKRVGAHIIDIMEKYERFIPEDILQQLEDGLTFLKKAGNSDELQTLIHGDFRGDNILSDGKRVSIIDWDTLRIANVYYEFVPNACASQNIPYESVDGIVDSYNSLTDNQIDKTKLKNLYILGVFDEYGRVAAAQGISGPAFNEICQNQIRNKFDQIKQNISDNQQQK